MKTMMVTIPIVGFFAFGGAGPDSLSDSTQPGVEDMAFIEGGTFEMGDIFKDGTRLASPVHGVTVSSFYLNKYEVTVKQFAAFVEDAGYRTTAEEPANSAQPGSEGPGPQDEQEYLARLATRGCWVLVTPSDGGWVGEADWRNPQYDQGPLDPVTCVSWRDAITFCNWLSEKEGLPAAYDPVSGGLLDTLGRRTTDITKVRGYRLPTEAEWEYAARERGRKVRFGNGQDVARSTEINFNAAGGELPFAVKGEFRQKTVPVGSFEPNGLGLHDMSGNVWEWCSDFVDRYTTDSTTNPYQTKGELSQRRSARGGPFVGDAGVARVFVRFGWVAEDRCNNIGFRVAKSK